jgi:uncharacterized membrane protein
MQTTILATFLEFSRTAFSMCIAGTCLFLISLWAARTDIPRATGLDKIVALCNLCFAVPLAVFAAEHFSGAKFIMLAVPSYMPWRLFWAYFVGFALLTASLSIATKIQVRWSGLLFGIMMFLFVAMIHFPRALASHGDRFAWVIVFREMSFAGGAWILAAITMRGAYKNTLIHVGRVLIAIAAIFFGVEHLLHPAACPGVPLEKLTPAYIPARLLIGYFTGAILLLAGVAMLVNKKTRLAATYLGAWIVLLVLFLYGPILIVQMSDPSTAVKVEGINYFADTLLFAGAILALASASQRTD